MYNLYVVWRTDPDHIRGGNGVKTCQKCLEMKDAHLFNISEKNEDGRKKICKSCERQISRLKYTKKYQVHARVTAGISAKMTKRQNLISKYGIATVEALDNLGAYWE